MMSALIEITDGGIGNSIQDAGRFGFRHMGITVSGALDQMLVRCANALVGNPPEADCACIEIRAAGPRLMVLEGALRLALAGDISAVLTRSDGSSLDVVAWQSITLETQDELEVSYLPGGAAYLAVSGGIDSPRQLGSRSTYQRALIGGIDGRAIMAGNLLPCTSINRADHREFKAPPWSHADGPVRVMLGPQQGHFKAESVDRFLDSVFQVTPQLDRMGVRLEGPALEHISPAAADIVSDGVTPGTIQVPGNGQPIILLADCQTVGGYPKVATVITADLPRLGQLRPGQSIRFQAVDAAKAKQALLDREAQWTQWASKVVFSVPDSSEDDSDLSGVWVSNGE
ncbi:MAG: biotin-dependent carboxyltransferase family protein [Betaproteobacteria bacterium]